MGLGHAAAADTAAPRRPGACDPGLLLFASFIVRTVADDASTTAGVAATVTTTSSAGSFGV